MIRNRHEEIRFPPAVQKESPLAQSPQRCRAELIRCGIALDDVVHEPRSHVVQAGQSTSLRPLIVKTPRTPPSRMVLAGGSRNLNRVTRVGP
jgi:hypothetical protein